MSQLSQATWRVAGISLLQASGLIAAYYIMPLYSSQRSAALRVVASLLLLVVVLAWQVREAIRAESQLYRGLVSLGLAVPLLIVVYASIYLTLSINDVESFSEKLGRTDALYFTMTTLTTIGYGDISPTSSPARITTMSQMVANVVVIGLAVRVLGYKASNYLLRHPRDPS